MQPTRRSERRADVLLALVLGLLASTGSAHESADRTIPDSPGIRLGSALAAAHAWADEPWPATRLPGILGSGETPIDRRNGHLEHLTADVGLRFSAWMGASAALGWHDSDPPHVEAAWLQAEQEIGDHAFQLGLGRNRLPMGDAIETGGHFDRFAAMPLAKRAVLNGDWIDDGVSLRWQGDHDGHLSWLTHVDIGLWRGQTFPGGRGAGATPALHLHAQWSVFSVDGFASTVRPQARGAYVQNALATHTHATPDCGASLTGIFCFEGRSDVVGGSASWTTPWWGIRLQTAGLLRRDRGLLYSANGEAQYRGATAGHWSDLIWPWTDALTLALRLEHLRGVQTLDGASAAVVAIDAGLLGSTRHSRQAMALTWRPSLTWQLSLEGGTDRQGTAHNPFFLTRVVWTPGTLWGRSW